MAQVFVFFPHVQVITWNNSWHSHNTKVILTTDLSSNVNSEQMILHFWTSLKTSHPVHTFIPPSPFPRPPLHLMAVSVWRLCTNTIFQKTNLLVVNQKPPFFLIICHEAICSCEFRALLCWYVREFTSRVNKKTGWSNWLPVCHVRFTRLPVWSTTDSFKSLNIRSITHQRWHLQAAVIRRLICSHLHKQRDSPWITWF